MLNTAPLDVAIIDFNRALAKQNLQEYAALGTPGYQPDAGAWDDTNENWDYWALGAIVLECDMKPNQYFSVKNEKEAA